jgi:hypothetical protein
LTSLPLGSVADVEREERIEGVRDQVAVVWRRRTHQIADEAAFRSMLPAAGYCQLELPAS